MFDILKNQLKIKQLFMNGVLQKRIVPFDEELYNQMSHTYIYCFPVSMDIKYLGKVRGNTYDRSFSMFMCFDSAILVRGEHKNGKENADHAWIEIGNYVYDPELLLRFDKDLYYEIYAPINVHKWTKEEYIKNNSDYYNEIKNTTLEDFKPQGLKRAELNNMMPLFTFVINNYQDLEFQEDFVNYLTSVNYMEENTLDIFNRGR